MSEKLIVCPKCKSEYYDIVDSKNGFAISCRNRNRLFSSAITCDNITPFYPSLTPAIKAWNRRADKEDS